MTGKIKDQYRNRKYRRVDIGGAGEDVSFCGGLFEKRALFEEDSHDNLGRFMDNILSRSLLL